MVAAKDHDSQGIDRDATRMSKRTRGDQPPPSVAAAGAGRSGRVQFGARGRAIWEWAIRTGMFDRNASTQRIRALTEASFRLELEETLRTNAGRGRSPYQRAPAKPAAREPTGGDPYSSGPARRPEDVTFNPCKRAPDRKR
jgi:hypothetical protein